MLVKLAGRDGGSIVATLSQEMGLFRGARRATPTMIAMKTKPIKSGAKAMARTSRANLPACLPHRHDADGRERQDDGRDGEYHPGPGANSSPARTLGQQISLRTAPPPSAIA